MTEREKTIKALRELVATAIYRAFSDFYNNPQGHFNAYRHYFAAVCMATHWNKSHKFIDLREIILEEKAAQPLTKGYSYFEVLDKIENCYNELPTTK